MVPKGRILEADDTVRRQPKKAQTAISTRSNTSQICVRPYEYDLYEDYYVSFGQL